MAMAIRWSRRAASRLLYLAAGVSLLLSLWSGQQAIQDEARLAAYSRAANQPPQPLVAVLQQLVPQGQRVWLSVRDSAPSLQLANARLQGRDGVREWQPVQLGDGSWVVIDRGWLPRPAGIVLTPLPTGRLYGRWVARPADLSTRVARIGVAGEVDALDWARLASQLPGPLRPGLVVLDPALRPHTAWPVWPQLDPQPLRRQAAMQLLLAAGLALLAWLCRRLPR